MNNKLIFNYGTMGCGKTRELLKKRFSYMEDGFNVVLMKPIIDKKGDNYIISRDKEKIKVDFLIKDSDNIYNMIAEYLVNNNLDVILVDEVQFMNEDNINQLSDVVDILGIKVICYGLLRDFQTRLFPGSKRLLEICDDIIEMERQCSCGRKKTFNVRFDGDEPVIEGKQISIDGIDSTYKAMCRKCYKKLVKSKK